ncbi:hypothetical protein NKH77_49975 [Streptomyces sp. M19]
MSTDVQHLLLGVAAVAVLVVLITKFKLHPFLALTLAALGLGLAAGISPARPSSTTRTASATRSRAAVPPSVLARCSAASCSAQAAPTRSPRSSSAPGR